MTGFVIARLPPAFTSYPDTGAEWARLSEKEHYQPKPNNTVKFQLSGFS